MENASNALLMVAAVLIGVMIISIGVYLFSVFGDSTSAIEKQIEQSQIAKFNSQFTKFEGLENCTIYDVVTTINLAQSNNKNYDYTSADISAYNSDWHTKNQIINGQAPNYIYVGLKGVDGSDNGLKQDITNNTDLIKKYSTTTSVDGVVPVYFKCVNVSVNSITKKVQGIIFQRLN